MAFWGFFVNGVFFIPETRRSTEGHGGRQQPLLGGTANATRASAWRDVVLGFVCERRVLYQRATEEHRGPRRTETATAWRNGEHHASFCVARFRSRVCL